MCWPAVLCCSLPKKQRRVLRIGRTTVYALMKAGDLRPVHIGRSCRLPRTELERYVRCLETSTDEFDPALVTKRDAGLSGSTIRTTYTVLRRRSTSPHATDSSAATPRRP